jgi:hypothetical protein
MLRAGVLIRRGEKLFSRVEIAGLGQCVHFFCFFGGQKCWKRPGVVNLSNKTEVLHLCKAEE